MQRASYLELPFPLLGVNKEAPLEDQPAGTTSAGVNVRAFDPLADRYRGGSRPGLAKYVAEAFAEGAVFQHLTSIVTVQGEALPWVDGDGFHGDAAGLLDFGPGGFSLTPAGPVGGGGGGYAPSNSFQDNRPRLVLTADDRSVPADGSQTTVRAFAANRRTGLVVGGLTITLTTSPSAREGDGQTQTTSFAGGEAAFLVSDLTQEDVVYSAAVTVGGEAVAHAQNTVTVSYGSIQFVQANGSGFAAGSASADVAYSEGVTPGNLLIVVVATFGALNVTVSDSQGNSFTQAGNYSNTTDAGLSVWYGFAGAGGSNTVTVAGLAGQPASIAVLEYSGADATPLEDVQAATGNTGTTWATPDVSVSVDGSLILGCFAQGFLNTGTAHPLSSLETRYSNTNSTTEMQLFVGDFVPISIAQPPTVAVDVADLPWAALGVSFNPG